MLLSTASAVVLKTIKPSGGDYSTIEAAWASVPTTLTDDYVFEVYNGTYNTSAGFWSKNTGGGSYTITFRAASGQSPTLNASGVIIVDAGSTPRVKFEGLTFYCASGKWSCFRIGSGCDGWRIQNCYLTGGTGDVPAGVFVYNGTNDTVVGNTFDGKGWCVNGVVVWGTSGNGAVIANNYFFNHTTTGIGLGGYPSWMNGHANSKVYYNTVVSSGSQPHCIYDYTAGSGRASTIYNNILVQGYSSGYCYYRANSYTGLTSNYNCFYKPAGGTVGYYNGDQNWAGWNTQGFDLNGTPSDPKLGVVPDYHIGVGSSCIDKGTATVTWPTVDIEGNSRSIGSAPDIGCDEYVPPPPPAPELSQPANHDTTKNQRPTFDWSDLGSGVTYHIQVDDENTFAPPYQFDVDPATRPWTPGTNLPEGRWYWRVRGKNSGGYGPWCTSFFDVFVDITPPAKPTLEAPVQDTTTDNTPNFNWTYVGDARKYRIDLQNAGHGACANTQFYGAHWAVAQSGQTVVALQSR